MNFTSSASCVESPQSRTATSTCRPRRRSGRHSRGGGKQGTASVVIDLGGVTFLDPSALGVRVAARTAAQRHGASVAVHESQPYGHIGPHRHRTLDMLVAAWPTRSGHAAIT
jgi:hypothetical protein